MGYDGVILWIVLELLSVANGLIYEYDLVGSWGVVLFLTML